MLLFVSLALFLRSEANLRRLREKEIKEKETEVLLTSLKQEAEELRRKLEEQSKEISQKESELSRLYEVAIYRELKMAELKRGAKRLQHAIPQDKANQRVGKTESRAALLNLLEDIKKAKDDLERERERNIALLGSLAYGVLIFNEKQILTHINPKAEEFLGLQAKDVIGRQIAELSTMPNPVLKVLMQEISENFRDVIQKDVEVRSNLTLQVTKTNLIISGVRRGQVLSLYDVTRERAIERLKSEFVSLAAHQLRTPLSSIKWALKVILEGDVGPISKEQREILRKTYASNERMIRLVNQLLELTRIEEGRYLRNMVKISMESLVESVMESLCPEAEIKNLEFNFVKPKEVLPQVRIDIEQMRLVVENIIENAIQYTLPGGKVLVSLKYDQKGIQLSCEDTGIGVPLSQQNRLFERFFRAKNAIRLETEGSGLGLYISKNIVEAHGGKMWFESQENKGSVFYIWLPEARF